MDVAWPEIVLDGDDSVALYAPRATSWSADRRNARVAVEIDRPKSGKSYGYVWIEARTTTGPVRRVAKLHDVRVVRTHFPAEPADEAAWLALLQNHQDGSIWDTYEASRRAMSSKLGGTTPAPRYEVSAS